MKKSLIALAVLAASGAAMAQSSVELYGRLDASLVSTSTKVNGVKSYPATKTGIESSQLNTQFWGLRGTEDLGGGLKAIFKLESNFNIDDGAVDAGGMFAREAFVGLSGGFGTVKAGRNYTAYDSFFGAVNHTWNSNINVSSAVAKTGLDHYGVRANNSVVYESPNLSGFSGSVSYGFGEDKPNAAGSSADQYAFQARYAQGPLVVGFAHQKREAQGAADLKHNVVGASYDFGVAKLNGTYQTAKQNATKDKDYQLGVSMPFGAFAVAVGYAKSKSETAGVKLDGSGYALVGTYSLSKRTTAYVGYENTKVESAAGATTTKVSNLAVGLRHTF